MMSRRHVLIDYTLHLADDALILGHRNSQWTGHGPILEQDIALSNIALDLIGQARNFYQYAASLINEEDEEIARQGLSDDPEISVAAALQMNKTRQATIATEDSLAFLRDSWDFRNCLLVEQDNGDWGRTILRQFLFSAYQYCLYSRLSASCDAQLAAISEKSYKEVSYHLRWSSEWVIRLGDGTPESHRRMEKALGDLWKFTGELLLPAGYEKELAAAGIAPDVSTLRPTWEQKVREVLGEAGLEYPGPGAESVPANGAWMQSGGKDGRHTEQLGYVLAEMQFLQRAYPGCKW
jgi:ring-1,2-phenylacetyl-CoA epoxidase subunit PaaC